MNYNKIYDKIFLEFLYHADKCKRIKNNIFTIPQSNLDIKLYCVGLSYLNWNYEKLEDSLIGMEVHEDTIYAGVYSIKGKKFKTKYPIISSEIYHNAKYICSQKAIDELKKKLNI